jgi:predicted HAD superfamily phosphohydrolase YqeG
VVGKPEAAFFRLALSDLEVPPSAAVMVGDDVRDDVGGALACGMAGILGTYSRSHLQGGGHPFLRTRCRAVVTGCMRDSGGLGFGHCHTVTPYRWLHLERPHMISTCGA